ncbi:hypothetical protein BRM95_20585 [Xanthomonas oryzae pv. oryzae]|nr:hypothetical protein BRM95_20585 [Xanthomonas oryzae pv. oryzae]
MTWATPFGSEVAQVRSPGSLHNRWCCDPELKPPLKSILTGPTAEYCRSERDNNASQISEGGNPTRDKSIAK